MIDVVFLLAREDQHVVQVKGARFKTDTGKDEIQPALESGRAVTKSEWNAYTAKDTTVSHENRPVTIFVGYWYLPESSVGTKCRINSGVCKAIDSVDHKRNGVRVRDSNLIEFR